MLELKLAELYAGLILVEDLVTAEGVLLVARGTEIGAGLIARTKTLPPRFAQEPILAVDPRQREGATDDDFV